MALLFCCTWNLGVTLRQLLYDICLSSGNEILSNSSASWAFQLWVWNAKEAELSLNILFTLVPSCCICHLYHKVPVGWLRWSFAHLKLPDAYTSLWYFFRVRHISSLSSSPIEVTYILHTKDEAKTTLIGVQLYSNWSRAVTITGCHARAHVDQVDYLITTVISQDMERQGGR